MSSKYDRVKGYVALDSSKVHSFDGVFGKYNFEIVNNSSLGNGLIMVANVNNNYFHEEQVELDAFDLIRKPDVPLVLRKGSGKEIVKLYVDKALKANQFDEAMGASEQYAFETNDKSIMQQTLFPFAEGKLSIISDESLSRSQRLLQGMSALHYILMDEGFKNNNTYVNIVKQFKKDYNSMNYKDWLEIKEKSNFKENFKYIQKISDVI
jgi:hypothetical protein